MVSHSGTSFVKPPYIKYKGTYDWQGLYQMMWQWMVRHRYRVHEDRYREKHGSPLGGDLKMEMHGEKEVTDYIKYYIELYFRVYDLKEFDVVVNGKTKKMTNGRIWIRVKGHYQLDYSNRFKGNKFLEALGRGYDKVQQKFIELKVEDDLHYHIYDQHAAIGTFLGMQFAEEKTEEYFDGRKEDVDRR